MGIRLVYGLQYGDATYLDVFYPSRRLKEAALTAGLDYAALIHSPSDPPSRILNFCAGTQEKHVVLFRGDLPDSLYDYLECEGVRVVNPAAAVALARDKLRSAGFFQSMGARHPLTILSQPVGIPPALPPALPLALPFVAKPRFGKMGRGVALIESLEQWSSYLAEARGKGQETIVQEFIGAATGRDVRFFFADFALGPDDAGPDESGQGGKWYGPGWVCVMRSAPGFLSNAHAGGAMVAYSPSRDLLDEAQRLFAASGLVYGTVDFLFAIEDGSGFVVCELNANPGFEELERALNIDVASAILGSVIKNTPASSATSPDSPRVPIVGKDGTP